MEYDLSAQNILITGANSGIGKAAAIQLARCKANVMIACRSLERGMAARDEILQVSNGGSVDLMQVDLSSLSSIRRFASEFLSRYTRLDVLIHNAANFDLSMKEPVLTPDGLETIFATNHVGPFLLTWLLLDLLKASSPSRIITVASKGLTMYPNLDIEFDNLQGTRRFSPQHAYYHSKLAQVMFTYDLAGRLKGTGVTVNCVRVTSVALPDNRLAEYPAWLQKIYNMKRRMSITPEQQAQTYVYLAADPEVAGITGGYWDEHNKQVRSSKNSYRVETWKRLWAETGKMAGIF